MLCLKADTKEQIVIGAAGVTLTEPIILRPYMDDRGRLKVAIVAQPSVSVRREPRPIPVGVLEMKGTK